MVVAGATESENDQNGRLCPESAFGLDSEGSTDAGLGGRDRCDHFLWMSLARQERGEQGGILLSFVQAGKTKDLQEGTERVTGPCLWQQACGLENLVRELSGQQPGFCDFVGRMR